MTGAPDDAIVVGRSERLDVVIEGLKLTMTGLELKAKLEERIQSHARNAAHYAKLLKERDSSEEAVLPESAMEGEIEKAHDQIETLSLIRDYIVADETYRLGEFDLRFADLLPEPDFMNCGCFGPGERWRGADDLSASDNLRPD